MKKVILFSIILLLASNDYCKGQIVIFGVDITKYKPSEFVAKKVNCAANPYFVFAEYSYQTVKFENYTAKNKTQQMKNPEKYTKELYSKLSKTLGEPFRILDRNDSSSLSEKKVIWRFKYDNAYYLVSLYPSSNFGHFLIVQVSNTYNSIVEQVKWMESSLIGYWSEDELLRFPEFVPPKVK